MSSLPEQMSEENGVTIENGKTRIGIIPVDGDYTHSVIKDNAILYNEVYEGADVQYTVLDSSIKEDIVLQQHLPLMESPEDTLHL